MTRPDGDLRLAGHVPANRVIVDAIARVRPGKPQSLGSMIICLDKPGTATITSVQPYHPVGNVTVQSYSVRPNPLMGGGGTALGDGHGPLTMFGFDQARHEVQMVCNSRTGAAYELGVQMVKHTGRDVGAAGWLASYTFAGHTGQLKIPMAVVLCSEWTAEAPPCSRLEHRFLQGG